MDDYLAGLFAEAADLVAQDCPEHAAAETRLEKEPL